MLTTTFYRNKITIEGTRELLEFFNAYLQNLEDLEIEILENNFCIATRFVLLQRSSFLPTYSLSDWDYMGRGT
jgi:hypothetical protein